MDLTEITSLIVALVIAITLHEAAHGFIASKLGDDTAKLMGRVTFNPLKHVDRVGTVLLPGLLLLTHAPFFFGYAKPVPVNFARLNRPRRDSLLVAFAGPGMNLLLAYAGALLLHMEKLVTPEQAPWLFAFLYSSITVNVVLAVFNMLPVMPLDGGRVLNALLPAKLSRLYCRSERHGILIVLLIFMLPPLLHLPIYTSYWLIAVPSDAVRTLILHAALIGNS